MASTFLDFLLVGDDVMRIRKSLNHGLLLNIRDCVVILYVIDWASA